MKSVSCQLKYWTAWYNLPLPVTC